MGAGTNITTECTESRRLVFGLKPSWLPWHPVYAHCWREAMNGTANTPPLVERFPALGRLQTEATSKSLPIIRQMSATGCGAACLAMGLAYYGKHVAVGEIRQGAGANRDGVDGLSLLKAGRWYGLQGRGLKLDVDALPFLERGTILHWDFSH